MRAPLLLLAVAVAGCAVPGDAPRGPAPPLADTVPHFVASLLQDDLVAVDPPLCAPEPLPAWHEVPRVDGPGVVPGTERLELMAQLSGLLWTGFQVGFRLDDGPFHWSPVIEQGSIVVDVDVHPDQVETDARRWTFAWRSQSSSGQDCTSGLHSGSLAIVVAAHVKN